MTDARSRRRIEPIRLERLRARTVEREHVRAIVHALPMPTAHPLSEAWPDMGQIADASHLETDAADH
jgi:hypothetical protein